MERILLISTSKFSISEEEFVQPIARIIKESGYKPIIKRYYESLSLDNYKAIIISGTAIKDFEYLKHLDIFENILHHSGSLLAICSGYQILLKCYGNELEDIESIGIRKVNVIKENRLMKREEFEAYFLHSKAISINNIKNNLEILAVSNKEVAAFKVKDKEFYGLSFHPEVLNKGIIRNFITSL